MTPLAVADQQSADLLAQNMDSLRALFPSAFTEGKIDFAVLRQLLGDHVDEGEERFGLNWHGKRRARQLALTPSTATLRPCPEDSLDWEHTQHLMLEGDNLEVLKLLQKSYAEKVKLIYIDPPYNTGHDFVYPDDFHDTLSHYLALTGQVEGGQKLSTNTETSGRFHTDWLNMIYPRLKLARQLLRSDGVIFISIDDNEVDHLRKVCDEIFGEENRVGIICHKARASVSNDKIISSSHNFILLYARDAAKLFEQRATFGLPPNLEGFDKQDARGAFKHVPVDGPGGAAKGNPHYTFLGVTGYWRFSEERMTAMHAEGLIEKVGSGLQQKYYLNDAKQSRRTDTTWWDEKLFTSTASSRLKDLMGGEAFDNPKPIELIQRMLELHVRSAGDIVLDFFGGSGTTGHAVMTQNAADGIARRFILVQLPEPLDPANKDQKVQAAYCDKLGKPRHIAELTKERLRRAAQKVRAENALFAGDLGFRVFKLASSNIRAWDAKRDTLAESLEAAVDHLKTDRTEQDILCEVLLKLGHDLTVPIESKLIADQQVHSIAQGALMACLSKALPTAMIEPLAMGIVKWHQELGATDSTILFRDSAFEDDVAKANLTAILQQHGIDHVRSL